MMTIHYINNAGQEKSITYESLEAYKQAQVSCSLEVQDHNPVTKVVIDGQDIPYSGNFGNLYYHLINQ